MLPVIHKVGESVDKVNGQLDKVDLVTDSAVDMADSVDTAVRAVSMAITRPVQKVSGLAAGVTHGAASLKAHRDWSEAVRTGKEAAATAGARPRRGAARRRRPETVARWTSSRFTSRESAPSRPSPTSWWAGSRPGTTSRSTSWTTSSSRSTRCSSTTRRTSARSGSSSASPTARSRPASARSRRTTATALEEEAGDGLGLRRLLETTMDSVTLSERDGGAWVELRKGYALAGSES